MQLKKNDILQTPDHIWQPLGPFDLDPCAGEFTEIGKVNWWDGRGENGLEREWKGFVWCNPPFSQKEIWAQKMIDHGNGILILPERGSAPWFGPLAESVGVYFVMGKKINFIGGPSSNNLGSILFPFGSQAIERIKASGLPGHFNEVKWFRPRYVPNMTIDAVTFGSKEYDRAVAVGDTTLTFFCPTNKVLDDFMNRIRVCASRRGHSVAFNPQKDPKVVQLKIFLRNT